MGQSNEDAFVRTSIHTASHPHKAALPSNSRVSILTSTYQRNASPYYSARPRRRLRPATPPTAFNNRVHIVLGHSSAHGFRTT